MSLSYLAYRILSSGVVLPVVPPLYLYSQLTGKFAEGFSERLGRYPGRDARRLGGHPRIWIHAVSVGEVRAAAAILGALRELVPESGVIFSTATETGQAEARKAAGPAAACVYAPVDAPFAVKSALRTLRPDLLVLCETEIWPNWLTEAKRAGVKTVLVNGRISLRSYRRYLRIRSLVGPVLDRLQVLSMISAEDALRIRTLGADPGRIRVNGNAKYDGLLSLTSDSARRKMAALLGLCRSDPVFVAGSVRGAELAPVLDAFCRIRARVPGAVLVAAPRHLENAAALTALAGQRGLAAQRRSRIGDGGQRRTAPVVVLDTIGELMAAYGTATVVFCGGSLAPLGGQNILEPAAWAKPVLYGPSTEDFADARKILEREGGGEQVAGPEQLADRVLYYITRPEAAHAVGRRALAAAASQTGAARRHAETIAALL